MDAHTGVEIRRLDAYSFGEALRLWNEGFRGYPFDVTLSLDAYLARMQTSGLSPELSLAALVGGRPAGFVLNGVRASVGGKAAWNGGTGVAPEFRRRGLGRRLIEASLDLYREHGVETATLEAIKSNGAAVALYQRLGYEMTDGLVVLEHRGVLARGSFGGGIMEGPYTLTRVAPHEVARLDFYDRAAPWQSQWQSVQLACGEGLIVSDASGVVAGYALYRKSVDAECNLKGIMLYQCEHAPGRDDAGAVVALALREAYGPFEADCRRTAHNLSESRELLLRTLRGCGFTVYAEQVHMKIDLARVVSEYG